MSGTTVAAEFDAVAYLESKGLHGKPAAQGREMTYPCFLGCGEPPTSTKRKLSVHIEDGFFQCWVCEAKGGSYLLQKAFGDEPSGRDDNAWKSRLYLDEASDIAAKMLSNNDELLMYLINDRGLDPETIIERKLGWAGGYWSLVDNLPSRPSKSELELTGLVRIDDKRYGDDWFYSHLLIPYINRSHVVHMRGRLWGTDKGARYLSGNGQASRVFNIDSLEGAEECIVTEGELDAIVMAQALAKSPNARMVKMGVVGLPGVQTLPEEFLPAMKKMKRVFIGFDSDSAGQKAAVKLKEQIGNTARILELPEDEELGGCDWSDYLLPEPEDADELWRLQHPYAGHDWSNVASLMSRASGRRVHSVAEAGAAFRESRLNLDFVHTGYRQFDKVIAPGLLPGQVVIPLAATGTGKTVFLCNLAYNMRERNVLYVSLEMTKEEIYERLARIYHFWHPRATDAEIDLGLSRVYICDENRLKENDLGALAAEYEGEMGAFPRVVFVDYLGYYARGFTGNSQYEKVGNAVMQLKAEAKAGKYTIIAPSQVNRGAKHGKPLEMDDARDAGTIEETADFLLSLYRPDDALQIDGPDSGFEVEKNGKLVAQLLKSRHGGKGKQFLFQMDLLTLAIVETNTPAASRAKENNFKLWRGHTYEALRKAETAPVQTTF